MVCAWSVPLICKRTGRSTTATTAYSSDSYVFNSLNHCRAYFERMVVDVVANSIRASSLLWTF